MRRRNGNCAVPSSTVHRSPVCDTDTFPACPHWHQLQHCTQCTGIKVKVDLFNVNFLSPGTVLATKSLRWKQSTLTLMPVWTGVDFRQCNYHSQTQLHTAMAAVICTYRSANKLDAIRTYVVFCAALWRIRQHKNTTRNPKLNPKSKI